MDLLYVNAHWMIAVFIVGYIFITLEHYTHINKATVALLMAVICWVLQFLNPQVVNENNLNLLSHHLADISQVIFFLLGAMTIVEIISVHQGFDSISNLIDFRSKRAVLWVVALLSFGLSAILDNLTTTIVMVSLLSKFVDKGEDRLIIGGAIVVAANAGGAWTPIGDVTTTMLWIGGQLTSLEIMKTLFLPSLICFGVAIFILSLSLQGQFDKKIESIKEKKSLPYSRFIFCLGLILLMFVPAFKIMTGLPPFMGMLLGLSVMWLITDVLHFKYDERSHLRVPDVLTKIDLSGVLFFLGILLCIDALDSAKILGHLAYYLDNHIGNNTLIATAIGLVSAVIDNVPLVAASMGMYNLASYPTDHTFWKLIAYCAGTGGSILLIGSAAGVVFMGMEKVNFIWYIKRISLPALVGYFAGIGIYLLGF